jgi:hypothetical protein
MARLASMNSFLGTPSGTIIRPPPPTENPELSQDYWAVCGFRRLVNQLHFTINCDNLRLFDTPSPRLAPSWKSQMPTNRHEKTPQGVDCISKCVDSNGTLTCTIGSGGNKHIIEVVNHCHFKIYVNCVSETDMQSPLYFPDGANREHSWRPPEKPVGVNVPLTKSATRIGERSVAIDPSCTTHEEITTRVVVERGKRYRRKVCPETTLQIKLQG